MISVASEERGIKTKDVRVTLEGLVAKSQAQRTKQRASVFCTAPAAPEPTTSVSAPSTGHPSPLTCDFKLPEAH
ncbi:hypothetical protein AB0O86_34225 [Streptomyces hirsutus]|uniref:hypothetical protein n=1 Tax=Streptomyces hirsutus TaxID=35620 RepID=UPI0034414B7E